MLDTLLSVFIIICMCGLCFAITNAGVAYEDGYERYEQEMNEMLENAFNGLDICEVCAIDESD